MHLEAHAMLGWAIGNLPKATPQMRRWCVLGSMLPDLDGLGFFFSPDAYDRYHHTMGHNLFVVVAFGLFMAWRCRSRWALVLGLLAFGSHVFTDAGLSGWPVYLFYPFSGEAFSLPRNVALSHPINLQLIYVGYAVVLLLALGVRRTPLELVTPRLDQLVFAPFPPYAARCQWQSCGRGANLSCVECGRPLCVRHTRLARKAHVVCEVCVSARRQG